MKPPRRNLTPSQAAACLGVSVRALRIYEQHGLLVPDRTAEGWRIYAPKDIQRATDVVSLRALGLSLKEIGRVLGGDPCDLEAGLVDHAVRLEHQARRIAVTLAKVRNILNAGLREQAPKIGDLISAVEKRASTVVGFALPWPWNGEWFELRDVSALNFITGPLGSGKTRFAKRLAEVLPDAAFLSLDRLSDGKISHRLAEDVDLATRVERALTWLTEDGADRSDALLALIAASENCASTYLVIDMVEQGLSAATQEAVISYFRAKVGHQPTLFLMTRSSSILDLDALPPDEDVIICPANHTPPFRASIAPRGRGHEAVATCLATPETRARTAGCIAIRSDAVV